MATQAHDALTRPQTHTRAALLERATRNEARRLVLSARDGAPRTRGRCTMEATAGRPRSTPRFSAWSRPASERECGAHLSAGSPSARSFDTSPASRRSARERGSKRRGAIERESGRTAGAMRLALRAASAHCGSQCELPKAAVRTGLAHCGPSFLAVRAATVPHCGLPTWRALAAW